MWTAECILVRRVSGTKRRLIIIPVFFWHKHIILCLPQSNVIAFPWSCPWSTLLLGNFVGSFRQLKLSLVDQTTRKYFFQAFTSLHLVQNDILMFIFIFIFIRCPERHFHSEILEFDISISDTLVSAILILLVTLAPLTGFHVRLVKGVRLRSLQVCATKIRVFLL